MRVGEIIETQQPGIHKQLNKKRKQSKKKCRRGKEEKDLSFNDYKELMSHDSYCRGKGGSIKQRSWSK